MKILQQLSHTSKEHYSVTRHELRNFGLIVAGGFFVLFGFLFPLINGDEFNFTVIYISLVLFVFSFVTPTLLRPFYVFWMILGSILGYINSRIILSVIYFLMIVPFSFIMRFFREDPLMRKISHDETTYRVINNQQQNDMEKPY